MNDLFQIGSLQTNCSLRCDQYVEWLASRWGKLRRSRLDLDDDEIDAGDDDEEQA